MRALSPYPARKQQSCADRRRRRLFGCRWVSVRVTCSPPSIALRRRRSQQLVTSARPPDSSVFDASTRSHERGGSAFATPTPIPSLCTPKERAVAAAQACSPGSRGVANDRTIMVPSILAECPSLDRCDRALRNWKGPVRAEVDTHALRPHHEHTLHPPSL